MNYGDRLQQAMDEAAVSRAQLAKALRISVQAVGQVLRGNTKAFDAENHTRAFLLLRCDPLWLATGQRLNPPPRPTLVASEPAAPGWRTPLTRLDWARVAALPPGALLQLEGAWLAAAQHLGVDLRADRDASTSTMPL